MEPLLKISNLSVEYLQKEAPVQALKNISFEVYRGETLALAGESGSGKSTIALCIMGLMVMRGGFITSGSIYFQRGENNQNLVGLKSSEYVQLRRSDISMVFQDPRQSFNPIKKIGDQVLESMKLTKGSRANKSQVLELFERVRLTEVGRIYQSYPHEVSGGQIQRAMIATAIARKSSLFIADEATSSLDAHIQKQVVELLMQLNKDLNWGVLFITHNIALVKEVADRVIILNQGHIEDEGSIRHIFHDTNNLYTQTLVACNPDIRTKRERLPQPSVIRGKSGKGHFKDPGSPEKTITKEQLRKKIDVMHTGPVVLKLENLRKQFRRKTRILGWKSGEVNAVNNVSLTLYKGEILGLIGESGSGKSTLAKLILRLLEPDSGKIFFQSTNISDFDGGRMKEFRKKVQIIFQNPYASFDPKQTIGASIAEGLRLAYTNGLAGRIAKEEVITLLESVGLDGEHYDRLPARLSGGQLQRASIARILAVQPELIICDEPVSSVDVSIQANILNLLKDLRDKYNWSYLFISHDLPVVHHMSDRIAVMKEGEILEMGDVFSLAENPMHPYTKSLFDSIPLM